MYRLFILSLACCILLLPACKKAPPTARSTISAGEESFEKLVKKYVEDRAKRDRLLHMVNQNRQTFSEIKIGFLEMTDKLRENPEVTREEAEGIVAEFTLLRNNTLKEMAERRVQMRQYATEEEWTAIHAALEKSAAKAEEKQAESKGDPS